MSPDRGPDQSRSPNHLSRCPSSSSTWTVPDAQGHIHLPPLSKDVQATNRRNEFLPSFSALDRRVSSKGEADYRPPHLSSSVSSTQSPPSSAGLYSPQSTLPYSLISPTSHQFSHHQQKPLTPSLPHYGQPIAISPNPPTMQPIHIQQPSHTTSISDPTYLRSPYTEQVIQMHTGLPAYQNIVPHPQIAYPQMASMGAYYSHSSVPLQPKSQSNVSSYTYGYYPPQSANLQGTNAVAYSSATGGQIQSPYMTHGLPLGAPGIPRVSKIPGRERSFSIPTYPPRTSSRQKRGNHSKQVTSILKEWLLSHAAHPYPSEEEKHQLSAATGLNMSQISNWFINARRRILQPIASSSNSAGQHATHRIRTFSQASSSEGEDDVGIRSFPESEPAMSSRHTDMSET